ncbi:DnaJ-class molecular chaperone [Desulfosalsimonas propionicica]|uniref:DnaJ-class molecular chaperone n=1 Tax=Desulfosalsimonas propionicica TaxID=332175 RepID=A0A7W0HKR2_9BACT|nr:DnaJ domain-containing protein [Desulfosalsimonas propionicica]MBA2881495.1 DnaJ-class molecular chaperone [Desulfosalsimonas propionicica]
MASPDYYQILGISKAAEHFDIKAAYRRRVLKVHPDVAKGEKERFLAVQQAFEVLSDPGKRKAYDLAIHAETRVFGEKRVPGKSNGLNSGVLNSTVLNRIVISALAFILFSIALKL